MNIGRAFLFLLVLPFFAFADDFERGVEALDKQDYERAIARFNACIRDNPKNEKAYINRGVAYTEKKQPDKAVADFTQAIQLDPKNAEGYCRRGYVYQFSKKDFDKAIHDYTQSIRCDPALATAYNNRGIYYTDTLNYSGLDWLFYDMSRDHVNKH